MKILFFCARFPYPAIGGDKVQMFHYLKGLAKRHDVTLFSLLDPDEKADEEGLRREIPELGDVHTDRISKGDITRGMIKSVFQLAPLQKYYYFNQGVAKRLEELSKGYDLVFYYPFRMAVYHGHSNGRKNMVCFPDSFALRYDRSIGFQGKVKDMVYRYEANRLKTYEQQIVSELDASIFINREDLEYLELDTKKAYVVKNGTYVNAGEPIKADQSSQILTFLGKMDYYPNELTAEYLVRDVFPKVKKKFPKARMFLIGTNPTERLLKYANVEDVLITGRISDPMQYLAGSSVFLAPMVIATGLQNKIIEAASQGIPVITNELGYSGLDMEIGKEILVSQDEAGMIAAIERLFTDSKFYDSLAQNGKQAIVDQYQWPQIWDDLDRIVTEVAAK